MDKNIGKVDWFRCRNHKNGGRVKEGKNVNGLLKSGMKKKISSVLAAAMICTAMPVGGMEALAETAQDTVWEYSDKVAAATYAGELPELPDRVRLEGEEHEVTWGALSKEDFMKEYGTVKVKGTVAGSDKTMEAAVEVIPEKLRYFVNCTADAQKNPFNGAALDITSAPYEAVAKFLNGKGVPLMNEIGDRLYQAGDDWGLEVNGTIKTTPDNKKGTVYDKYDIAWRSASNGIVYRFKLPAGTYELTAGFKEMYTDAHTRKMRPQVTFQGENGAVVQKFDEFALTSTKNGSRATATSSGIFTLPKECVVEYKVVYVSNDTPNLNWIGISELDGNAVSSISGYEARQVVAPGEAPKLPDKVAVMRIDGTEKEETVNWEPYDASSLTTPYRTSPVTIKGTVENTDQREISVTVDVIPATLKYFIDCGTGEWGPASGLFELIKENNMLDLLNETSDQRYQEGRTWGYIKANEEGSLKLTPDGTKGTTDSIYNVGVRTNTGDIVYKMQLPKGSYRFTSGYHDWWDNQTRVFQVVLSYEDEEGNTQSVAGEEFTMKNQNNKSFTLTNDLELPLDAEVTFTLKYVSNAKPVLSFISVEEDYFSSRTPERIEVAKLPDRTIYGVGEQLDPTGMEVKAYYEGNLVENAEGYEVSGFDSSQVGEAEVTVAYKGKTATFKVTVSDDIPVYDTLALMAETFLLKGETTADNAKLFWNPVAEAAGYRVYKTDEAGTERELIEATKAVSLDVCDMEGDTDFVVEAYDVYGQLMAVSNTAAAKVIEVPEGMEVRSNMPPKAAAKAFRPDGFEAPAEAETALFDSISYTYKIEKDDQFGTDTAKKIVEYVNGSEIGRTVLDGNQYDVLKDCKFEGVSRMQKDGKIIIWAHFEKAAGYSLAEAACIFGTMGGDDFTLYHERPQGNDSRDLTIYREGNDIYLISSTNMNRDLNIYKLDDSWTKILPADQFPAITVCKGEHREAPSLIKKDGWYYLFSSQANDWFPSSGKYCSAKSLAGLAYAPLRPIHTNTYGTQSGYFSGLGGQTMMVGNRWAGAGGFGEQQNWSKMLPLSFQEGYAVYSYYPEILYNSEMAVPVQNGRNLSVGQPIGTTKGDTAAEDGYDAGLAVDGSCYDETSYYKPAGNKVPYTITVDLGQQCEISQIDLTFRAVKGSDTTNPYKVYGSRDGVDFDTVLVDASDLNAPGFDSREVTAGGTYRFVRLVVENVVNIRNNGSASWASGLHEFSVYGAPVEEETDYAGVPVGEPWLDNRGATIQAHGGGFLQMEDEDGTPIYYWAGEDKTHNRSSFNGINLYSSKDLVNWKYENTILKPDPTNPGLNDNKIERPKLIYNKSTGKFILWGHWETRDSYSSSQVCVAVSDTVNGNYEFLGHWRPGGTMKNWRQQGDICYYENDPEKTPIAKELIEADGNPSRDMTVYVDGETAYLVSACAADHSIAIYELNEEFTDVAPGKEYHVLTGEKLEAPAIVKAGEYYYLIGSGQSGWYPNQGRYAYTKNLADVDSWSEVQWFANNTTFYSQPTNIMTLTDPAGKNSYVYMGDRWNPNALRDSTYVWLPLDIDGGKLSMEYLPEWSLDQETGECQFVRAENLSVGRPVKATEAVKPDNGADRSASIANDGSYENTKKTGDSSDYYQPVETPFYWMVDLENEEELTRIDLAFRMYNGSEAYHQYKIYGSSDENEWTELVDESSNTTTGFKSHRLSGTYRYVKVEVSKVVNDHNGNSASWAAGLVEVTVFGGELPPEEADRYTEKIEVTRLPDRMDYEVDEEFDPAGMEVTVTERVKAEAAGEGAAVATSSTATRVLQPEEYEVEYDFSEAGERDVTVSYLGTGRFGDEQKFTDRFAVHVLEEGEETIAYTQKIEVTKLPDKVVYEIGDEFEPEGMEVTEYIRVATPGSAVKATGSNASHSSEVRKRLLDEEEYDVEYEFDQAGKSQVTVIYLGTDKNGGEKEFYASFKVTVNKKPEEAVYTTGIKVTKKPKKTVYQKNEEFDPYGMEVTVSEKGLETNKSFQRILTAGEYETEYDFSVSGTGKVKIVYYGTDKKGEEKAFTAIFNVKVAGDSSDHSSGNSGGSHGSSSSGSGAKSRAGYPETTGTWLKDDNGWKFADGENVYRETWIFKGQKWYYIGQNSYMETGWKLLNGKWYYLDPVNGDMKTGWLKDNATWYWLDEESGQMEAGSWKQIAYKWYYFNEDGSMAAATKTPDGHTVGADGARIQ